MANDGLVARLMEGADHWNEWIQEEDIFALDLRGADLAGVSLERVSLVGADLTSARLDDAFLFEADLGGAIVTDASFARADLRCASLSDVTGENAVFRQADLRAAVFSGSDLAGADFRELSGRGVEIYECNLSEADFSEADLSESRISGCSFERARFGHTVLGGARLWDSVGLLSSVHGGPSWVDPRAASTIERDAEIFLKGAGWPDRLIENWRALTAEGLSFYSCFISYSRADMVFAHRLYDALQGRGVRCWLDRHALLPGDEVRDEIDRGIRIWDKVVLCCSEASLTSWWVDQEIEKALQKEERLWKERGEKILVLVPIRIDDFVFDGWESGKKSTVTSRHIGDFRNWDGDQKRFKEEFDRLIKGLSEDPLVRGVSPSPKL